MTKKLTAGLVLCTVALAAIWVLSVADVMAGRGGDGEPIVYVTSQDLFYDSIVLTNLPAKGPFQLLELDGPEPNTLQTAYGPGDPEYRGGRWWVDLNGDGEMDDGDLYFSCPLLGPGRETP